jgi:phosphoenolpyruvate-protein phosphotransferase (PTS system enzyme I)
MSENVKQLQQLEDPYLSARADDMEDLKKRMINRIQNRDSAGDLDVSELDTRKNAIIVADNLSPTQTIELDLNYVRGFITAEGGGLSHTAILAKSLGLPAIVNSPDCLQEINEGDLLVVDAAQGLIVVNPDEQTLQDYQQKLAELQQQNEKMRLLVNQPAQTRDGHKIALFANIGTEKDIALAKDNGAEGVGLFRSEFLFMGKKQAPSEEEQFLAYRHVVEQMDGNPVILRTLDIGGDKDLAYLEMAKEMNPFLGKRAIRLCFDKPEILHTQLRAAVRASAYGKLKIMFPMVISIEEIRALRTILDDVTRELRSQQVPIGSNIEMGAMVETPAAVMMAAQLIEELDFFSIGSNDLTQYMLAVDRCNPDISHLYNPLHPAVIRAIKQVVDCTHRAGKWVGVCGEMAACEKASMVLVGLGVDELSVSSPLLVNVKQTLSQYTRQELSSLAQQVANAATSEEIEGMINKLIKTAG